jgi:hypothetical protein
MPGITAIFISRDQTERCTFLKGKIKPREVAEFSRFGELVKTIRNRNFDTGSLRNSVVMKNMVVLLVDALINLVLGVLLLIYSPGLAGKLGVPVVDSGFYPNILGAVFIGITIALLIEALGKTREGKGGLGLTGAVSINLCGGSVLLIWLILGRLDLSPGGAIFLWALGISLIILSLIELIIHLRA